MARNWAIWAAVLLLQAAATGAPAQTETESDWQEIALLNGRLVISAPPKTEIVPSGVEHVMAAAPSQEMTTKLSVPAGPTGNDIVVYVHELYALFPQNPESHFRDNYAGGLLEDRNSPPHSRRLGGGLTAYGAFEGRRQHPSGNHVLADFLVAQADGTTQEVFIMTWDVGPNELDRLAAIATRMVATLRPGPRQGLTTGGRHILTTLTQQDGKRAKLQIDLPQGYTLSRERGPDFSVFRVGKLAPLDAPLGGIGIYLGDFPSPFYAELGLSQDDLKKVPARILRTNTAWLERRATDTAGGPDWIHREVILPMEQATDSRKLHLILAGPEGSGELETLTHIAEHGLTLE
jgi:hypothetical protein